MAATKATIRALPTPTWTVEDIYHVGTALDTWGRVTVVFKRGPLVKHVLVEAAAFQADAVKLANLK